MTQQNTNTVLFVDNIYLKSRYHNDKVSFDWNKAAQDYDKVYAFIREPASARAFVNKLRELGIEVNQSDTYLVEWALQMYIDVNRVPNVRADFHFVASDERLWQHMPRVIDKLRYSCMFVCKNEETAKRESKHAVPRTYFRPESVLDYLMLNNEGY